MSKFKKEITDEKSSKPNPFQKFLKKEAPQEAADDVPRAKRKRISKSGNDSPFGRQEGGRLKKENPFGDKKPTKAALAPVKKFANPFEPKNVKPEKKTNSTKEKSFDKPIDYFDIKKNNSSQEESSDGRKKFYSGLSESKKKFDQRIDKKKFEFGEKHLHKTDAEQKGKPFKTHIFDKKEFSSPRKTNTRNKNLENNTRDFEKPSFEKRENIFTKGPKEKQTFPKLNDKKKDNPELIFEKKRFTDKKGILSSSNEIGISKENIKINKTLLGDDFFAKSLEEVPTNFKKEKKPKPIASESDIMRLNKFVAQTGLCSRRKAVEFIKEGHIFVNGVKELNPAYEMQKNDVVKYNSKEIKIEEKKIYLVMNKPKNVITTSEDEKGRKTVLDLIKGKFPERIYPIGRLDRNTTGLLLLTNDGDLSKKLSHPSHMVKKIYHVVLDKNLKTSDLDKIKDGLQLEDGVAEVDEIYYIEGAKKNELGVEIHSGKNRIVRRIFESLNYQVEKLDRTYYAGLTKKDLPRGFARELTEKEVIMLKHFTNRRKGES
ncbi:MAG: hypothetical protein RLZZ546_1729 [Bacteroidota bacterium]|jgi:23S rRNA pseudouridine2605 synthase